MAKHLTDIEVPSIENWRSTDREEIQRPRVRPQSGELQIANADRTKGFAAAAHEQINSALLRCEERYPNAGPHSVLYVVVEGDVAQCRAKLDALHEEYFGPGQCDPLSPVRLEVIDRGTDEAVQRLNDLGLLARTTRATRALWPGETSRTEPAPLSDNERLRVGELRQQANRKIKMARLLHEGDFGEESRSALLHALLPLGSALAIEARLPEPVELSDVLAAPLAQRWGEVLTPLRLFVNEGGIPSTRILEQLAKI